MPETKLKQEFLVPSNFMLFCTPITPTDTSFISSRARAKVYFILFFYFLVAGNTTYPAPVKIMAFCVGLMFGAVIRLPLMCRTLTKSSFILSGTIIFIAFGILGTFYHMQSLNLSLADEYPWLPIASLLLIGAYYAGGIAQNGQLYGRMLTSNRNRFAVQTLALVMSWLVTAGVCHKFNHAIWYVGIGWIYYNIALVTFFLMVFVLLLMPHVETVKQMQEVYSTEPSESFSRHTESDASTDVTMDGVLIA